MTSEHTQSTDFFQVVSKKWLERIVECNGMYTKSLSIQKIKSTQNVLKWKKNREKKLIPRPSGVGKLGISP